MPKRNATPKSAGAPWHRVRYVLVRLSASELEQVARASSHAELRPGAFARRALLRAARRALRAAATTLTTRTRSDVARGVVRQLILSSAKEA